ncbi:regulator of nonsense transcripts 2-like [Penaeus chinensis]|uniref:regulator of nonsense transcripts 2-like n=1 Tax=Penaeus chinensis TaxID=139456 RepID=UPI001FB6D0E8|nr:regulator of nonsense transcripts 2-like [Penaeus chinensis]XP_047478569.1 regulator of nonsense transcripts 2-like [Penaeus chinensis]XP_047478570.1 regulator of nonsense transcripts 2-like [Penaeus chinensis]XP_047478572.1 regulator of nonsense transcripts 2-like [Penaeus chinensis]
MDGVKSERRGGKSWRKEREERERKRVGTKAANVSKESEEKKENDDPESRREEEMAKKKLDEENKLKEQEELAALAREKEEEERKQKEEEERQQREEAARKLEEDRVFLLNYIQECEDRLAKKKELRAQNLAVVKDRPELNTALLDSSLKKNTAFIKKLKNLTESQHDSLVKDLQSLNLTKYVSEVAQAVVETKLKMSDISTAVHLCSLLHQRYHDFAPTLLENWQKVLTPKKDEKISNMSKLRVDLRLYAELITAGIFLPKEGLPLLGNVLTTLVTSDKEEHQNIAVLLTFCRHCGEDYMGLVPRKIRLLADQFHMTIPKSDFLPPERQKNVRQLLKDYFVSLSKHLFHDHKELQQVEKHNRRLLQTRGELGQDRVNLAENLASGLTKLVANTQQMAELLDEDMPELPEDKSQGDDLGLGDIGMGEGGEIPDGGTAVLWEDEDTRAFYENLPELKALIPSILYSDSEKPTAVPAEETPTEEVVDTVEEEELDSVAPAEDDAEEVLPPEFPPEEEPEDSLTGTGPSSNKVLLDAFLSALPNCINRDLIDSAAMDFCLRLNTKPSRKKLVRALFLVPRTRLDLLSFYSRLVATLQPLMPDLATDLVNMLRQDFKYQVRKKDQINIESKIKVVRFIGELVKFKVYPRSEALQCLRMLLQDFSHHHVEMACNLLETCGRFLYRIPDSHHRTKIYLEQMMRKKTVKAFDPRYNTMIENAYFYVNPPDSGPETTKKERPPMHQYIRKLLYDDLCKSNTEKILRQMRKMHWEDPLVSSYIVKCLTAIWNAKFYNIRCIANLVAGLISHHDWVGPAVVDGILEDIRIGLEVNHPKFNQRRVAAVKYLGELYNYRVIESSIIFKVLYLFISFGVVFDPSSYSEYDPPEHLFRLRLVCTLLETCGQFFSSGSSKRRLDCYLCYFQHYYQYKRSLNIWSEEQEFPWQIEHLVRDTIAAVRPKLQMYINLEEAQKAVTHLNNQIVAKAIEQVPSLRQFLQPDADNEGLHTITEEGDSQVPGLDGDVLENLEEEEEFEDTEEGEMDWSESHGDSLTPSQHSQPCRSTVDEEGEGGLTGDAYEEIEGGGESLEGELLEGDMKVNLKHVDCKEDNDFMSAFDRMMAESILERTSNIPKAGQFDISVPVHVKSTTKKTYDQLLTEGTEETKPVVNFVLMTRSGNKQQYNNVEMPLDSEIVTKLRSREEAERAEKEKVKRMTLEINERQEEEEAAEIMQQAQRPATMNFNRDRRPKYQHPKGAPDADLIFGPKKIR